MLTPKEQLVYDRLKASPKGKMLIDRLGLEPVLSDAFRRSTLISARINDLISTFQTPSNLPAVKRTVFEEGSASSLGGPFATTATINAYLETIYGKQPWKYPLPFAPF